MLIAVLPWLTSKSYCSHESFLQTALSIYFTFFTGIPEIQTGDMNTTESLIFECQTLYSVHNLFHCHLNKVLASITDVAIQNHKTN
jgi:hypothetical protein